MSLDDLIAACGAHTADSTVARLVAVLSGWKNDSSDVNALAERVERLFGNSWIASETLHSSLYGAWTRFRHEAIEPIGGQTMNERLYYFSLSGRFDACGTDDERAEIYAKLLASP